MADGEDETSPLEEIVTFLRAMNTRYGRVPALKKLGRLTGRWFLGGGVFLVACVLGESVGVGLRKAAGMYWQWWVWTPVAVALVPIGFRLVFGAIEIALVVVVVPFVLVGDLIGRAPAAFFKRVFTLAVFLFVGWIVAGTARNVARSDATPKPAGKAAVVEPAPHPALPATTPATPTPLPWFTFRNVMVALVAWLGGVASHTVSSVTSIWARRLLFDERPEVLLYGPNDQPDPPAR